MPSILSAKSAMTKHAKGMSSRFGRSGKRSSTKDIVSDNNDQGDQGGMNNTNEDKNQAEESLDKVPQDKTVDELRREEIRDVMKDRSLSKEEKARRMEEVKQKYGKSDGTTTATQATAAATKPVSHATRNSGRENIIGVAAPPPPGGVDLSAKAAANKSKREMESLFRRGGGKDAMSTRKESCEKQLLSDKPSKIIGKPNNSNDPELPSLDSQRRAEIQSIMKNRSLEKEERRRKIEETNKKYAEIAKDQREDVGIDLSAKSYAQKPRKELESTHVQSFSDRKAAFENQSEIVAGKEYGQRQEKHRTKDKKLLKVHSQHRTKLSVNVDPTSFALAENGLYGVQQKKKKSIQNEYGGRFH